MNPEYRSYQGFTDSSNKASLLRSLSMTPHTENSKLIIIMVGLPARGKSYISRKICNFMCWRGHKCKVFNVGQFRRESMSQEPDQTADFFSAKDKKNLDRRNSLAKDLLEHAIDWLRNNGGQIAIFDATNTTKQRRKTLVEVINKANYRFLFIESICDCEKTIMENLKFKAKRSPDFEGMSFNDALNELKKRLKNYENVYESVDDSEGYGYIKLINLGEKLVSHKLHGYISRLLMVFLLNLNINKKVILLTRAGNSTFDYATETGIKGNYKGKQCGLSREGLVFARKLASYVKTRDFSGLQIWSSSLKRAVDTAQFINIDSIKTEEDYLNSPEADGDQIAIFSTPILKMVHQGICYGMKSSVIKKEFPDHFAKWQNNLLTYRFPGGESYMDACERVESIVIDLEQIQSPVLIITHLSMMRILYAYFKSIPVEKIANISFPQGLVIEFVPTLYGWHENRHDLMENERKIDIEDRLNEDIEKIPVESENVMD